MCSKGKTIGNSKRISPASGMLLPEEYGVQDIEISSIKLRYNGDSVDAAWGDILGEVQMVKFDRESVKALLADKCGYVALKLTGKAANATFEGTDTIRVIIE